MTRPKHIAPQVQKHLDRLRAAGVKTEPFFRALFALRRDPNLSSKQLDALRHVVAMEGSVWFLEALSGEAIDRQKALSVAEQLYRNGLPEASDQQPLPALSALLQADIAVKKKPASKTAGQPTARKGPVRKKKKPKRKT